MEERNLRKVMGGTVLSNKMDKTVVVAVETLSLIHISILKVKSAVKASN